MEKILWHTLPLDKVFKKLKSSKKGLSEKEVGEARKKFGSNILPQEKTISSLVIFLNQLKSPLVYVLLIAGAITFVLQDFVDMTVILLAVFLNTILGFYQE